MVNYANLRTSGGYSDISGEHDASGNLIKSAEEIQKENQTKQVQSIINAQQKQLQKNNIQNVLMPGSTVIYDKNIFGIGVQKQQQKQLQDLEIQKQMDLKNKQNLQYELLTNPQLKFQFLMQEAPKQETKQKSEKPSYFSYFKKQYSQLSPKTRKKIAKEVFFYENKDKDLMDVVPKDVKTTVDMSKSNNLLYKTFGIFGRLLGSEAKKEEAIDNVNRLYKYKMEQIGSVYGEKNKELKQKIKEYNKIADKDLRKYNFKVQQLNEQVKRRDEYVRQHGKLLPSGKYVLSESDLAVVKVYDEGIRKIKSELDTPEYKNLRSNVEKLSELKKEIDKGLEQQEEARKKVEEINTQYEKTMEYLNNYNLIDKKINEIRKKEYKAKSLSEMYKYRAEEYGLKILDFLTSPLKLAATFGENVYKDYSKGKFIDNYKRNQGLVQPLAKSFYDFNSKYNELRDVSRKINWDSITGTTLLATGIGGLSKGMLGKLSKGIIKQFGVALVATPVFVSGGQIATHKYLASKNQDYQKLIEQNPGKIQEMIEKGYQTEYSKIGKGLRGWAVQNVPFANKFFGKEEEYKQGIIKKAMEIGYNEQQAKSIANSLSKYRNINNYITVGSVLGANFASEIAGGLRFGMFKTVEKPFIESFVATGPAGALEGGSVYLAQQMGTTNKIRIRDVWYNSLFGAVSAGTISGIINKGAAGTLFGGKTKLAVSASKKAGEGVKKLGYLYDWYEYPADKLVDWTVRPFLPKVPLKVRTFTPSFSMTFSNTLSDVLNKNQEYNFNFGESLGKKVKVSNFVNINTQNIVNDQTQIYNEVEKPSIEKPGINVYTTSFSEEPSIEFSNNVNILSNTENEVEIGSNTNVGTETRTNVNSQTQTSSETSSETQTETETETETETNTQTNTQTQTDTITNTYSSVFPPVPYGRVGMPGGPYQGNTYEYFMAWVRSNKIRDLAGQFFGKIKENFENPKPKQITKSNALWSMSIGEVYKQNKNKFPRNKQPFSLKNEYDKYDNIYNSKSIFQHYKKQYEDIKNNPEKRLELQKYRQNYKKEVNGLKLGLK